MADSGKHQDDDGHSHRQSRRSARSDSPSRDSSVDGREHKVLAGSLYYRWDPTSRKWTAVYNTGDASAPAK